MQATGTVLVVDNTPAVRQRIGALLSEIQSANVITCATEWAEVQYQLRAHKPCCMLINVPAYSPGGLEIVRQARKISPSVMVIVVTDQNTEDFRSHSISLGIEHFVIRPTEIDSAVQLVSRACSEANTTRQNDRRVLLLIEDNHEDVSLFEDLLRSETSDTYDIVHVVGLEDAAEQLRSQPVEIIVLDLRLPDSSGLDTIRLVRNVAGTTPIVVLTGLEDKDQLAFDCIGAGAQDFLTKGELTPRNLRRAIGYAINRERQVGTRDMQSIFATYRTLSSATQGTTVTAALAGSGAIASRSPAVFEHITSAYVGLLHPITQSRPGSTPSINRELKEHIITAIGDAAGGPRDLIDVHLEALERLYCRTEESRGRSLALEARLLALEMMGLLVDYYRIGFRRRNPERAEPS